MTNNWESESLSKPEESSSKLLVSKKRLLAEHIDFTLNQLERVSSMEASLGKSLEELLTILKPETKQVL